MTAPTFIILHGLNGSPPGHWQSWLAGELESRGHLVHFPNLPKSDRPNFGYWKGLLHLDLNLLPGSEKVVIAHSLGALLWLHYAADTKAVGVSRVLLVCPPELERIRQSGLVSSFPDDDFLPRVRRYSEHFSNTLMLGAVEDPWCSESAFQEFAEASGATAHVLKTGHGHINPESGFGPWPPALEWALGDKAAFLSFVQNQIPSTKTKSS